MIIFGKYLTSILEPTRAFTSCDQGLATYTNSPVDIRAFAGQSLHLYLSSGDQGFTGFLLLISQIRQALINKPSQWHRQFRYPHKAACFTHVSRRPYPTKAPTTTNEKNSVQGVTPRKPSVDSQDSVKSSGSGAAKRITTPHACAECKRRKM